MKSFFIFILIGFNVPEFSKADSSADRFVIDFKMYQRSDLQNSQRNYLSRRVGSNYSSSSYGIWGGVETFDTKNETDSNFHYGELSGSTDLFEKQWAVITGVGGGNNAQLKPTLSMFVDFKKNDVGLLNSVSVGYSEETYKVNSTNHYRNKFYRLGIYQNIGSKVQLNLIYQFIQNIQLKAGFVNPRLGSSISISSSYFFRDQTYLSLGAISSCIADSILCKGKNPDFYKEKFIEGQFQLNLRYSLLGKFSKIQMISNIEKQEELLLVGVSLNI